MFAFALQYYVSNGKPGEGNPADNVPIDWFSSSTGGVEQKNDGLEPLASMFPDLAQLNNEGVYPEWDSQGSSDAKEECETHNDAEYEPIRKRVEKYIRSYFPEHVTETDGSDICYALETHSDQLLLKLKLVYPSKEYKRKNRTHWECVKCLSFNATSSKSRLFKPKGNVVKHSRTCGTERRGQHKRPKLANEAERRALKRQKRKERTTTAKLEQLSRDIGSTMPSPISMRSTDVTDDNFEFNNNDLETEPEDGTLIDEVIDDHWYPGLAGTPP
jgi:hypothetical protein